MKKISVIIIISITIMLLSSCVETHQYEYLYDETRIETIDIVYVEMDQDDLDITLIMSIDDMSEFIHEFNQIEFQKYLYVDQPTIYQKISIMITYDTNDIEIITYDAQEVFFDIDQTSRQGRFYCSKEVFEAFLQLYDEEIQID